MKVTTRRAITRSVSNGATGTKTIKRGSSNGDTTQLGKADNFRLAAQEYLVYAPGRRQEPVFCFRGELMADRVVSSRDDLLDFMFELLDHNDAVPWKNDDAYKFLQHMAAWLDRAEDREQPTWQLIGDMLSAAAQ